ncbi:MAG: twin-arginine translocase TatA/TatE family subunit [Pseudomonadota bacterium]
MLPGFGEWVIILLIILTIFGASRIPKLGKALGEGIKNFKSGIKEAKQEEDTKKVESESDSEQEKA